MIAPSRLTVRLNRIGSSSWSGLPGISHLPSTVIPTGPGDAGLPIGVQIIGPAYGDLVTIQSAQLLEREGFAFQAPPGY